MKQIIQVEHEIEYEGIHYTQDCNYYDYLEECTLFNVYLKFDRATECGKFFRCPACIGATKSQYDFNKDKPIFDNYDRSQEVTNNLHTNKE